MGLKNMLHPFNHDLYGVYGQRGHALWASTSPPERGFSPGQVEQIIRDPMLRPQDCPEFVNVGRKLIIEPNDLYLQEYFSQLLRRRLEKAIGADDLFYANNPPQNTPLTAEPAIWAGNILLTGDSLPVPLNRSSSGTAITGLPGCGKTTFAMLLVIQLVLAGALVVVWEIKRTWRKLLELPLFAGKVIVLSILDLIWSLLQPPPGTKPREWANRFTKVLSQTYARISAQRVVREIIDELFAVCPSNCWPTPKILIQRLKAMRGTSLREKEYIASLLWVLTDLNNHFPDCFEYTYSDFPKKLFSQGGRLVVVENNGSPTQHWNFPICMSQEWISAFRQNSPGQCNFDVIFVLEDSTSLLDSARDRETPGGVSLLAQNLDLGREMRIGTMAICHSLGQISPKIVHSLESIFVCSLRGDDLARGQQVLGITPEQAEFLRVNPRGTACALVPSVWPLPVMISFPPLLEVLQ